MPPRKGKKPSKTPAVIYDWMGDPGLAQLLESQLNFLYENGETAPLIIRDLCKHGTITIPNPSEAGLPSSEGSSIPAPTAPTDDDLDWDVEVSKIESSILGKRPQLPSPASSAALASASPARVQIDSTMAPHSPTPLVPVHDWDQLLNMDSRVRGGKSNGSRYESNGLELTVVYCEQV
jgi:hypothetical protein